MVKGQKTFMGSLKALGERPKDVGYRFGFIAILLIVITAIFPAFISIGVADPMISAFQGMFLTGLVGTMFFSSMLRNASATRAENKNVFSPQSFAKQMGVLMVGVVAGLVMIISNSALYGALSSNLLAGSVWGTIDPTAIYLGMLAGVSEELFFRGFIGTFLRLVSPNLIFSVIFSAAIFSLFHWFAYGTTAAFVVLFMLGIVLGLIHEFTNDIGAPMLAHVLNNTFAMMPLVGVVILGNMPFILLIVGVFVVCRIQKGVSRGRIGGIKLG